MEIQPAPDVLRQMNFSSLNNETELVILCMHFYLISLQQASVGSKAEQVNIDSKCIVDSFISAKSRRVQYNETVLVRSCTLIKSLQQASVGSKVE